jgi:ureidoacrylate peracid hydrolase
MGRRYWEWEPAFRLDARRAALLVVDMQNGFVEPGAPLEVPMARAQVPVIRGLVEFCRARAIPVVFTAFCVGPDAHYPFYWAMARQRGLDLDAPASMFGEGRPETAIVPALAPEPGERVVTKCGYDAFANTGLEPVLRARGVTDLIVAGTVVNWCVDSTVRAAFHRFYRVVVVADGVSGYDHAGATGEAWRDMELDLFAEAFGRVLTADRIMKEL